MKVYLASRYSRRLELCEYRKTLESLGHTVTSRWLNGDHQISDSGAPIGESGEKLVEGDDESVCEKSVALRSKFANEDLSDVEDCDVIIAFTEAPRSSASRGGRHVELGLALGMGKEIVVVGYRENIFCWLEDVNFFPDFKSVIQKLEDNL